MTERLSKAELVELVEKLCLGEGTEDEEDAWIRILKKNILYPGVIDLIYWPKEELTPEEIVDKALSYQPIILPEGRGGI